MNWSTIETVFFDMDGTLIDLNFEDTFWLRYMPENYAKYYHLSYEQAIKKLAAHSHTITGTLNWYCIDYWDRFLGFDTLTLAEDLLHLLEYRPNVKAVLRMVKKKNIHSSIITNAHPRNFKLKDRQLNLSKKVDSVVSSHQLKLPKENIAFWYELNKLQPFNPDRTLLIDDNISVLDTAKAYGIKHLLAIPQPNSQKPEKPVKSFTKLHDFSALLPENISVDSHKKTNRIKIT